MSEYDTDVKPIPVVVIGDPWPPPAKDKRCIKKTTLRTYILDPLNVAGPTQIQISDYEPGRVRLVVQVIDAIIAIMTEPPAKSPDIAGTGTNAPQGRLLPPAISAAAYTHMAEYEFFGPDAFWLNSLTGAGTCRVTVTKEYE